MAILHLLAPANAGGLERVVQSLAIGQRNRGHEVAVASVVDRALPGRPFYGPLERAGVAVHELIIPPRRYLRERSLIVQLCRRIRPDILHSHGYRTDVVDGGAVSRLRIPIVSTVHGYTGGDLRNRLYERVHEAALRRFDAVAAVSRPVAERLLRRGVDRERLHVVPNAWSEIASPLPRATARARLGVLDDRFLVGWVGRMTHEKGLDLFVEALGCLGDLPVYAAVLGEGPEAHAAQSRAKVLNLGERVTWAGLVPEASRLFAAFDAFVLSSRTEGVPIVLFEAMAAAVPIVATRVGGVPDILSPAEVLLVEPEDPSVLAAAMRSIYEAPDEAHARASNAQQTLRDKFGLEHWLNAYDTIYRGVSQTAGRETVRARS